MATKKSARKNDRSTEPIHYLSSSEDEPEDDDDQEEEEDYVDEGDVVAQPWWEKRAVRYVARHPWKYLLGTLLVLFVIVLFEGYTRRNLSTSLIRPSVFLNRSASVFKAVFRWFGWQLARLLNLYELFRDMILDLGALMKPTWRCLVSPLWFFDGWYQYFMDTYDEYVAATIGTPTLVIVVLGVCILVATARYYWKKRKALQQQQQQH